VHSRVSPFSFINMNTTKEEKKSKGELVGKCWSYLNDNFHKFTETNKIKIALEICKKDMPTELTGEDGAPLIPASVVFTATKKGDAPPNA